MLIYKYIQSLTIIHNFYFSSRFSLDISFPRHTHDKKSSIILAVVTIIGHVYSLKLILYGTKEDPLASNTHFDRTKTVATFTKDQISQRKKGQLCG